MIYTCYFAKLKHLPDNIIPVSICIKAPNHYTGLQYKKLAPKYSFFSKWKENRNDNYYRECFQKEILDTLSAAEVVNELYTLVNDDTKDIALICYEKPCDFCHRHLVSDWLRKNGFKCKEWTEDIN